MEYFVCFTYLDDQGKICQKSDVYFVSMVTGLARFDMLKESLQERLQEELWISSNITITSITNLTLEDMLYSFLHEIKWEHI